MLKYALPMVVLLSAAGLLSGCSTSSPYIDDEDVAALPDIVSSSDTQPVVSPSLPPIRTVVDREYRELAKTLIYQAQERVDLYHFEFVRSGSAQDVFTALQSASARGVNVRVFLDDEPEANPESVELLVQAGVDARIHKSDTRMHLKVLMVDSNRVLLGSTNLSGASLDFNNETNVQVTDVAAVELIAQYLESIWANPNYDPTVVTGPESMAVRPWMDGGYLAQVLPALNAAQSRVDAIVYGINLSPQYPDGPVMQLANALYAVVERGVTVRVLFEQSNWNEELNDLNAKAAETFKARGIEVRFDSVDTVTHSKLLLVDNQAFVGTNNWGYTGLELSHELGVSFSLPEPVSVLSKYFDELWMQ